MWLQLEYTFREKVQYMLQNVFGGRMGKLVTAFVLSLVFGFSSATNLPAEQEQSKDDVRLFKDPGGGLGYSTEQELPQPPSENLQLIKDPGGGLG